MSTEQYRKRREQLWGPEEDGMIRIGESIVSDDGTLIDFIDMPTDAEMRARFPELFEVIDRAVSEAPEGTPPFNLPDMRDRGERHEHH